MILCERLRLFLNGSTLFTDVGQKKVHVTTDSPNGIPITIHKNSNHRTHWTPLAPTPLQVSKLPCTQIKLPCTQAKLPCTQTKLPCTQAKLPCTQAELPLLTQVKLPLLRLNNPVLRLNYPALRLIGGSFLNKFGY